MDPTIATPETPKPSEERECGTDSIQRHETYPLSSNRDALDRLGLLDQPFAAPPQMTE